MLVPMKVRVLGTRDILDLNQGPGQEFRAFLGQVDGLLKFNFELFYLTVP